MKWCNSGGAAPATQGLTVHIPQISAVAMGVRSVTLFGALPPNRTQTMTLTHSDSELGQLMEGTTAGAIEPAIHAKAAAVR
jgi:hypothetical protein